MQYYKTTYPCQANCPFIESEMVRVNESIQHVLIHPSLINVYFRVFEIKFILRLYPIEYLSLYTPHYLQYRSTSLRLVKPFVLVRSAAVTPPTRFPNTRPVKLPSLPKVSVVTIVSNPVMVVKPNLFSTRKPRLPRRLSCVWNVPSASTSINSS